MINLDGKIIFKNKYKYIKITRNQLLILDALLYDGGFKKKYIDRNKKIRYSEHEGWFRSKNSYIDKIIINANITREDYDDDDILFPQIALDSYQYEYIFHTHPPTPTIGGRVNDGILYEFPSINDILYFIDHYNMNITKGSIVITSEGYYIISVKQDTNKLIYDDEIINIIFKKLNKSLISIQRKAITKYGTSFSDEIFYSTIAKDKKYLKMYNFIINKYLNNNIKITLKTRDKDILTNKWLLKSLYIKI